MNIATLDDLERFKMEIISHFDNLLKNNSNQKKVEEWLTIEEVMARFKRKSRTTVNKYFTPQIIGGKKLFKLSDIEKHLTKNINEQ